MLSVNKCYFGDCRDSMRRMLVEGVRVQTCVTSPPYWGLRDYGVDGQLGLEKSPEEYVAAMVEVFGIVRELLSDDGTLWLNLGDSYYNYRAGKGQRQSKQSIASRKFSEVEECSKRGLKIEGLKEKDLVGIPWRVAFALQEAGWYLRSDIIWSKPNPMPESVTDRPTRAHEYIFLLSKSPHYYYDHEAIKERAVWDVDGEGTIKRAERAKEGQKSAPSEMKNGIRPKQDGHGRRHEGFNERYKNSVRITYPEGKHKDGQQSPKVINGYRNKRSVWEVATRPYTEAHFATFPPKLIEPCILAGSRSGDVVFDPFFGSGTTGEVAQRLGRKWIGCELNPAYESLQQKRTEQTALFLSLADNQANTHSSAASQ